MLKIEYIWRELLFRSIEQKNPYFTLTQLSRTFNLSTNVVSHALSPLRELQMVKIGKTESKIVDSEKLLYFWATRRNLKKDIIYTTYSPLPVFERETLMPGLVTPTAYSFLRLNFQEELPSDYDKIYFYAKEMKEVEKRFPKSPNKEANIYILKEDPYLSIYKHIPLSQVFADLWNLPQWYAKEFGNIILAKIKEKLGL